MKYIRVAYCAIVLLSLAIYLSLPYDVNFCDGAMYLSSGLRSGYPHFPALYISICNSIFVLFQRGSASIYVICFLQWLVLLYIQYRLAQEMGGLRLGLIVFLLLSLNITLVSFEKMIASEALFCGGLILTMTELYGYERTGQQKYLNRIYLYTILMSFLKHIGVVFLLFPLCYLVIESLLNKKFNKAIPRTIVSAFLSFGCIAMINFLLQLSLGKSHETLYGRPGSYRINMAYSKADKAEKQDMLKKWQAMASDSIAIKSIEYIATARPDDLWIGPYQRIDSLIKRNTSTSYKYKSADEYENKAYLIYIRTLSFRDILIIGNDVWKLFTQINLQQELEVNVCKSFTMDRLNIEKLFEKGAILDPAHTEACDEIKTNKLLFVFSRLSPFLLTLLGFVMMFLCKRMGIIRLPIYLTMVVMMLVYAVLSCVATIVLMRYTIPILVMSYTMLSALIGIFINKMIPVRSSKQG